MIEYPYLPKNRTIKYTPSGNKWMREARKMTDASGCSWWPNGAIIVKNNKIIGKGSNTAILTIPCARFEAKCPTGEGYDLCNKICKRKGYGHSEYTAVENATRNNQDCNGADLYFFGHWWCCEKCWDKMIESGIKNVYLLKDADKIFTYKKRSDLQKKLFKEKKIGKVFTLEDTKWKI